MKKQWIVLTTMDGEIRLNLDKVEKIVINRTNKIVEFYFSPDRMFEIAVEGKSADVCLKNNDEFDKLIAELPNPEI